MKQYKIFVIANLIFGILLIVLTKMILPVCHPMGGGVMRCGTSTTVDAVLGLVLLVIAVLAARFLKKKAHVILSGYFCFTGTNSDCGNMPARTYGMPRSNSPRACCFWCADCAFCGAEFDLLETEEAK